ncbi:hypothetical protein G6F65_015509 [Rhizopus arrhizus]|nr:hypothetical protein G6F65_015509 [Rhizopus arrhizus]
MRKSPDPFAPPRKQRAVRQNSLLWILDPLEQDASYVRRKMFGCDAAYLDDMLYLVVADRDEPWNGVMPEPASGTREVAVPAPDRRILRGDRGAACGTCVGARPAVGRGA